MTQVFSNNPFEHLKISFARHYTKLYSKNLFIGITGSVGKSTCVEYAQAVLSNKFKTLSTVSNLDPVLNIPKTLLKLSPKISKVILEMGIDNIGQMDFYLSLVKPKVVVFNKIGYVHSEFLGDLNEIIKEEGKLIEQLTQDGVAILNWDDPSTKKLCSLCKGTIIYYGTDAKNCNIWAGNIKIENYKTNFELNLGVERVKINSQLLGRQQVYPALAGAALGVLYDIPLTKIKIALESVKPQEHKLQPLLGPNGSIILDDTDHSSPTDMEASIDTLLQIPARRRILVMGAMRDLGEYSDLLHRQIGQMIYKEKIDLVILGQGDTQIVADELKSLGFWEERLFSNFANSQIVNKLLKTLEKGDVCLIKGGKVARLDEVVKRIVKK